MENEAIESQVLVENEAIEQVVLVENEIIPVALNNEVVSE